MLVQDWPVLSTSAPVSWASPAALMALIWATRSALVDAMRRPVCTMWSSMGPVTSTPDWKGSRAKGGNQSEPSLRRWKRWGPELKSVWPAMLDMGVSRARRVR